MLRSHRWLVRTLVALTCGGASFAVGAQVRDGVTPLAQLGSLSDDLSVAFTMNDRGDIVDQSRHNVRLRFRRTIIDAPNGTTTEAADVNNAGVVVGVYNPANARAFAWTRNGGFVDLEGVLTSSFSLAHAINECGQIVGELGPHAVRWNTFDEIEDLGTLGGGNSVAHGINDRGDVVGYAQVAGGRGQPFLWTEEQGMRQVVECEGQNGSAIAINNAREVIGGCDATGAFFWSRRTGRIDLNLPGFPSSSVSDINDRGEVVGEASSPKFGGVAFKWMPRKHRIVLLRDLGDSVSLPRGINQVGWIVGDSIDSTDTRRAVAWVTPKLGFKVDPGLGTSSSGVAVNDFGSAVGTVIFSDPSDPGPRDLRAVLWEPPPTIAHVLAKRGARRCLRPMP